MPIDYFEADRPVRALWPILGLNGLQLLLGEYSALVI